MGIERVIAAPVEIRSCRKRRPVGYRWKLGLVLGIAGVRMSKFAVVVGVGVGLCSNSSPVLEPAEHSAESTSSWVGMIS
jgi:hypothetical protein